MTLAGGLRLGPYEIIAPIGAGGMGEVYRARDSRLDRDVAIKVLPERTARDEHALSRFRRETKALAALSHPNILMILDVGEHEGVSYAVMELLEGETLRQRLNGAGVDPRKALEITAAIADGLAAAHARDIIHRDLKPENLFLTKDGVVKILDFGLARTGLHSEPTAATVTAATVAGVVLGTVNYMSPEQVRAEPADAQSDIFSLGCVLYEMLTGQPPFVRETSPEIMTAILRHHPKHLSQTTVDVPPDVDPIVMRCLEKSPEERFNSARDLAFSIRGAMAHGKEQRRRGGLAVWVPAGLIGLLAVAAGVFDAIRGGQSAAIDSIDSIAVLPFVNASGDLEQEYFADGMTEALIADLAKIRALKVISRTSVMQFKGVKQPLPAIAKSLNVDVVVEGSVLRAGDRVRITAQLIHALTDEHLWAESYDRDLRDVLRLQSEVAQTIAQEIKVTLTPQEQARMAAVRPVNPEAHEAYLKGRFYWNKRTAAGVTKALEYFEQAVALSPDWALAHLGLADTYVMSPQYGSIPAHDAMPKAKSAAAKALELDDALGEAHATLGLIAENYDWDWTAAPREFDRALALSPNYATGHHWYAVYLVHIGRAEEAVQEMKRAQELDPLSLIIGSVVGMAHWAAGRLDDAEAGLRRTLELGPDYAIAHANLALTLFLKGGHGEAILEVREAVRLSNNAPKYTALLGYMCAKTGQFEESRRILDDLIAQSKESYVAPTYLVRLYAGLGETDKMFAWLEKAYEERDGWLLNVLVEPSMVRDMHADPRFADLIRRIGLPMPKLAPSTASQPSLLPSGDNKGDGKIMLAVLPFENLSRDPDQEYFSDGLTEEMITQLGRLNPEKLGVIARSSAMHYKNTDRTIERVRKELGVDYVIEGSVRRGADNRVRITANLIQCSSQTQLWADSFERELKDILALQSDVAQAVAQEIKVTLAPQVHVRIGAGRPVNPAAHEAYLRGRFHWNKRTAEGLRRAIEHFQEAIALAPDWAAGHAGLADAYELLPTYLGVRSTEAIPKARAAAIQALSLDDSLAEAHATLAAIATDYDWDWRVAEQEFERSLALSPNYAQGHAWFGMYLIQMGRRDEAMKEVAKAQELDPLSLIIGLTCAWVHYMDGNFEQAEAWARKTLELDPRFSRSFLGKTLCMQGRSEDALQEARHGLGASSNSLYEAATLGYVFAGAGDAQAAREVLDDLTGREAASYVSSALFAQIHAGFGDRELTFARLEKAYQERDALFVHTLIDPLLAPMRSDPRFADLLRRVGLPMPKPISPVPPLSEPIPGGLP